MLPNNWNQQFRSGLICVENLENIEKHSGEKKKFTENSTTQI